MKIKQNFDQTKLKTLKSPRLKKPKVSVEQELNSHVQLRRSARISERRLQVQFSLPECDDSENEADDGAYEELLELDHCEDNRDVRGDCISYVGENDCDGGNGSDDETEYLEHDDVAEVYCEHDQTWGTNTEHFDNMDNTFSDSANVMNGIEQSEIHFFETIFDHRILSNIVTETNRYAKQNNSKDWTDVTLIEMKAFIGCLIVMGIHQLPALKHYWSSDPFLHVEAVASVMTANRFKKIVENLHCNDNDTQPPKTDPKFDKLHKVKPMVDVLNENIRKVYKPSDVVTVDESMIPFKGRYALKQYMPKKPVKWGYKVWCLCDAYTGEFIL